LTIEGKHEDDIRAISLWDIARTFRVQVTGCENLNIGAVESVYTEVGLYHGGEPLCPVLKTHQVSANRSPRWAQWLNFDIPCYNIPRETRLCITVYGRWNSRRKMEFDKVNDVYPLGWVNVLLMDYKGYLKTGLTKVALWPNERANPIGTCVSLQNSAEVHIYLRFPNFPHPVIFPTQIYDDSYETKKSTPPPSEPYFSSISSVINSSPLTKLDAESKRMIWNHRYYCLNIPEALPKVLQSARWGVLDDVVEVHKMMKVWNPVDPIVALELLDSNYADTVVRAYAVSRLEGLDDSDLLDYLLQLVQVLKYEPFLDCALARFLLKRALNNKLVGHHFFWYLRSEMEDPSVSLRFAILLEAYLRGCGSYMDELIKQNDVLNKLSEVAMSIKRVKTSMERKEVLSYQLNRAFLPPSFQVVLNPKYEANRLIQEKCKYMDSKKLPLWCVFGNKDPAGQDIYCIFKSGDDLRQDMLTLQMIKIMDKLWRLEGLDLRMTPYGCISTGNGVGLIEVVLNAETVSSIQISFGGSTAAFKDQPLEEWLQKHNPDEKDYEKAVETFTLSCAGYCVATYVLGIGDRHNDNIMVTKSGNLFHIDFGHFLGNIKKKFGFKRERAPFVLTPDFVYVMGKKEGMESAQFKKFVNICVQAFLILRKHANMFINLFAMMLSTGIPELKSLEDIYYLRDALCLGMSEEAAAEEFENLIFESLRLGWSTQLNWWLHNLLNVKTNFLGSE
jgi:phosphatidylinositol-4,5-bisphosphate 3-kinase